MNYKFTLRLLGIVSVCEGVMLVAPLILSAVKGEDWMSFALTIGIAVVFGLPIALFCKPKKKTMRVTGGLVSCSLCWILMSVIGCLPFVFSHNASFVDALFETVSGFTTTGATIFSNPENLGLALNLWRAMTHWVGGMGMLLFVIAFLPKTEGTTYQVFKAETPGPKAGKLVSKLSITARILYLIYFGMTVLCAVLLLCAGLPVYDSVVLSFATAGTGGFTPDALGIAMYNSLYVEVVLTAFMFMFSINFTLYYFVLIGKVKELFRSEEVRWFFSIILLVTTGVTLSLWIDKVYPTFGECLRVSVFQVVSNISTTGYVLRDTSQWPALAQTLLLAVMFCGGCAGSTAGGLKVSRIIILGKSGARELRTSLNPNRVLDIKLEGRIADKNVVHGVLRYFVVYVMFIALSVLALVVFNPTTSAQSTLMDAITSTISCVNNVGPGAFDFASGNFASITPVGKAIMTLDMLAGRLEILPILMLFNPRSWQR